MIIKAGDYKYRSRSATIVLKFKALYFISIDIIFTPKSYIIITTKKEKLPLLIYIRYIIYTGDIYKRLWRCVVFASERRQYLYSSNFIICLHLIS